MSLCAVTFKDAQSTSRCSAQRAHWAEATSKTSPDQGLSGRSFQRKDDMMAHSDQARAHKTIQMTMWGLRLQQPYASAAVGPYAVKQQPQKSQAVIAQAQTALWRRDLFLLNNRQVPSSLPLLSPRRMIGGCGGAQAESATHRGICSFPSPPPVSVATPLHPAPRVLLRNLCCVERCLQYYFHNTESFLKIS